MNSREVTRVPQREAQSHVTCLDNHVKLAVKESAIHGLGCFSLCSIPADTLIGEYCGERIDLATAVRRNDRSSPEYSDFILEISDNLFVDGAKWDGPIRFINHSCEPNCRVVKDRQRAFIVTARHIISGEELTIDYCFDQDVREACACGSPICRGYM